MEAEIYKALDQLVTATGLTGDSGIKRLLKILSDTAGSFLSQYDSIVVEQGNRDGVCYDPMALLADEIATAVKEPPRKVETA
jgi:hypothetical protein